MIQFQIVTWFESQDKDSDQHEVKAIVSYELVNRSHKDTAINGIMSVYSLNGDFIKSYSYPNGFTIGEEDGLVEFPVSIDKDIDEVMLKIHFTDLEKKKTLSNEVTTKVED